MKVRIYRLEPIFSHLSTPLRKDDDGGFAKEHWGQSGRQQAGALPAEFDFSQRQLEQRIPKTPKAAGMKDSYHDMARNVNAARRRDGNSAPYQTIPVSVPAGRGLTQS
jgi:hypothetical protein